MAIYTPANRRSTFVSPSESLAGPRRAPAPVLRAVAVVVQAVLTTYAYARAYYFNAVMGLLAVFAVLASWHGNIGLSLILIALLAVQFIYVAAASYAHDRGIEDANSDEVETRRD